MSKRLETVQGQLKARHTEVIQALKQRGNHLKHHDDYGSIYEVELNLLKDCIPIKCLLGLKNGALKLLGTLN